MTGSGKPVLPDEDLIRAAVAGDEAAFRELLERYKKRAFGVALGIVGDPDEAQDVVQDAFIKAYYNLKEFRHFFTDVPVLATIPAIRDVSYQRKMRIRQLAVLGGLVSFTVILMVFLAVYGHKVRTVLQEII